MGRTLSRGEYGLLMCGTWYLVHRGFASATQTSKHESGAIEAQAAAAEAEVQDLCGSLVGEAGGP